MSTRPFDDERVAAAFQGYAPEVRPGLLSLRELIFNTADELDIVATEALRWGQPAYLTREGTTVRLHSQGAHHLGIYVHCQTTLIPTLRARFGDELTFEGTRGIALDPHHPLDRPVLTECVAMALTYKLRRRKRGS